MDIESLMISVHQNIEKYAKYPNIWKSQIRYTVCIICRKFKNVQQVISKLEMCAIRWTQWKSLYD